jgi:hypothetical protein
LILMQRITEWTDEQIERTRAAIAEFKELRPLVRDAKIIHLLPPRYNVDGVGWGWDAIQAVAPNQSRSVVMVYRALGDVGRKRIQPRGLRQGAVYRVRADDRGEMAELTSEAIQEGIELELGELESEILRFEIVR